MLEIIKPLRDEETFRRQLKNKYITEASKMMNSCKSKKKYKKKKSRCINTDLDVSIIKPHK